MTKIEIIENAILETMKNHPDWICHAANIMYDNAQVVVPIRFSSSNNARSSITATDSNDFIEYILSNAMLIYGAVIYDFNYDRTLASLPIPERSVEILKRYPGYSVIFEAIKIISNPDINAILYYHNHQNELFALANVVASVRFNPSFYPQVGGRQLVDPDGKGKETRSQIDEKGIKIEESFRLMQKIEEDHRKIANIQNVRIYNKTLNKCLLDILDGKQLKNCHNEYALDGTLFATQDIGKRRENQEDSVVIMTHPLNPEFKLIAVADGMGGVDKGEEASSYTIKRVAEWFTNLPVEYYNKPEIVSTEFSSIIKEISNTLVSNNYRQGIKSGTTFTGAIVTENKTVINHVGDSRAYTIKDGQVRLRTIDESRVWPFKKDDNGQYVPMTPSELRPEEIDDLRFRPQSNQIYGYVGQPGMPAPQSYILDNEEYETLLIMSDGVSDLLSMPQIKILSGITPAEYLTQVLVETALSRNATRDRYVTSPGIDTIQAGKDNATVAAINRRK